MAPKRKATPSPSAPTPTPTPPSPGAPTPTASAKKKRGQQEPVAPRRRSPRLDTGSTSDVSSPAVAAASLPKRAKVEKKSTKASLTKVEEEKEVADEGSKSGEESQSDESTAEKVLKTVVIEHCKQCKSFTRTATEVKEGLEKALPGIKVVLNPEKPRRGCFEVRVEGEEPFISLLDMKRPFSDMKALDMKIVVGDIVKKME